MEESNHLYESSLRDFHECCLLIKNLPDEFGMRGRASAKGFESKHFVMAGLKAGLKALLAPIVSTQVRQQLGLLPGMSAALERIKAKRGPARRSNNQTRQSRGREPWTSALMSPKTVFYFMTVLGNLLPNRRRESSVPKGRTSLIFFFSLYKQL